MGLTTTTTKVLIIEETTFLTLSLHAGGSHLIRESPKVLDPALCDDRGNVFKDHFTVQSIKYGQSCQN